MADCRPPIAAHGGNLTMTRPHQRRDRARGNAGLFGKLHATS